MSQDLVKEIFIDNYYRVLVVREKTSYVVSVDVYYVGWRFHDYRETCVDNVCILIAEAPVPSINGLSIRRVLVVGVKAGGRVETINVKWFVDREPSEEELYSLYKYSWIIAGTIK